MNKQKQSRILSLMILVFILLASCGPKTMEQQVEEIIESDNSEERKSISFSLADSLNNRPAELLFGLHSNPVAVEALKYMLSRYSELIKAKPSETQKVLECIRFIAEPSKESRDNINQAKLDIIIHALQIDSLNNEYELTLINALRQQGEPAMVKIIDAWYEKKRSGSILNAIKSFDDEAIALLISRIEKDTVAVDLLARFGQPIVGTMIEKMKDKDQNTRFAAGDVLVQMQKYDPDAIHILTSAIDEGGTKIIARNYPFYIRLGQFGTEELLLKALDIYFNQEMCVDYLNSGSKELESGASGIAANHGYSVTSGPGNHYGPKWGSGN